MATRGNQTANTAATTAAGTSAALQSNAGGLYNVEAPALINEATHPAGYAPTDLAAMNTAAQQSAGGSEAAAVGQGGLKAARTHNAGGSDAAIADAVRTSGQHATDAALQTQTQNANAKLKQQQEGMQGLGGLQENQQRAALESLGQIPGDVNASTNAENASWDWTKGLEAIGQANPFKYTKSV